MRGEDLSNCSLNDQWWLELMMEVMYSTNSDFSIVPLCQGREALNQRELAA